LQLAFVVKNIWFSCPKAVEKMSGNSNIVSAAALIIGDEILCGRTADINISTIAGFCAEMAIELREARVVADQRRDIVEALNALRKKFTYVFTTGGIGPTHDDPPTRLRRRLALAWRSTSRHWR